MFLKYFKSGFNTLKAIKTFQSEFSFKESYSQLESSMIFKVSAISASIFEEVEDQPVQFFHPDICLLIWRGKDYVQPKVRGLESSAGLNIFSSSVL